MPVRPRTVQYYYVYFQVFFNWLLAEKMISESPLASLAKPVSKADQIQPFSKDQITALLEAAKHSLHPRRDVAILMMLVDTGIRATELCQLRYRDVDTRGRSCVVRGKGNKRRQLYFGRQTAHALWLYKRSRKCKDGDIIFPSDRGVLIGQPLTRSGLRRIFVRLGRRAGIQTIRCSPHSCRHTFAIEFLRAGGNTFALQQLLGHSDLSMTLRYTKFADADIAKQHKLFSPGDRLTTGIETPGLE